MYTYEMYGVACNNSKTYESKYGTFNREDGFIFDPEIVKSVTNDGTGLALSSLVEDLCESDLWKIKKEEPRKMTLQDLEKELGYRVQIIDPEPDKKKVSPERKKEIDDTIDMFERLFGMNFKNTEDYY